MAHEREQQFVLPDSVVGPVDAGRLNREMEELDEYLRASAIRKTGAAMQLPKTTVLLDELAEANHLNLLQPADRRRLVNFLHGLSEKAPVLHVSFAADPSSAFTAKIVRWLRQNIHPFVLVQVGLQPSIAAGCTVRSTNKYFDFSLRQHLLQNRQMLINALAKLDAQATRAEPPAISASPGRSTGEPAAQPVALANPSGSESVGGSAARPQPPQPAAAAPAPVPQIAPLAEPLEAKK
jgi:F0F1-type ATP synthase delta subunit